MPSSESTLCVNALRTGDLTDWSTGTTSRPSLQRLVFFRKRRARSLRLMDVTGLFGATTTRNESSDGPEPAGPTKALITSAAKVKRMLFLVRGEGLDRANPAAGGGGDQRWLPVYVRILTFGLVPGSGQICFGVRATGARTAIRPASRTTAAVPPLPTVAA